MNDYKGGRADCLCRKQSDWFSFVISPPTLYIPWITNLTTVNANLPTS